MKHLIPLAACVLLATVAAQAKPKIAFVGLLHSHCWRQLENVKTVSEVELVGIAESNPELVAEAKKINPMTTNVKGQKTRLGITNSLLGSK